VDIFARVYDYVLKPFQWMGLANLRRQLVASARGRVLEIGAGTGLNFEHYPQGIELIALEPDAIMLKRAAERARDRGITLVEGTAEELPFPDNHFDSVVLSLVLCTVENPTEALREIRRVLRPGGKVFVLEHVRAPQRTLAGIQDLLTPIWRRVAGGCHLNRDTASTLAWEGYRITRSRRFYGGSLLLLEAYPR